MHNIYFLGSSLFEISFYFFYWSLFGWVMEVIVRTLETGGFENRGFLNGPVCPIYGFGVLLIYFFLSPVKNVIFLFVLSVFICSSLELFVGVMLQKIFHAKWWDYSHERYNYKGFICLKNSLLWGVGCLLVVHVMQPALTVAVDYIPYTVGNVILIILFIIIAADTIFSVNEILHLNEKLKQIDKITSKLYSGSNIIGENISDEVLEMKNKYDKLVEQAKGSRILKAFPHMMSENYNDTLKTIKDKLNKK